jgi:hypothetical protein
MNFRRVRLVVLSPMALVLTVMFSRTLGLSARAPGLPRRQCRRRES